MSEPTDITVVDENIAGPILELKGRQGSIQSKGLVQLPDGDFLLIGSDVGGHLDHLFATKVTFAGEVDQTFGDSGTAQLTEFAERYPQPPGNFNSVVTHAGKVFIGGSDLRT